MRLVLLSILVAASASAQPRPESTGVGRIIGVVTDAKSGAPVAGARVWAEGVAGETATDIDGRYALPLPAGTVALRMALGQYDRVAREVVLGAGETASVDVRLTTGATVGYSLTCLDPPIAPSGIYVARIVVSALGWGGRCSVTAEGQTEPAAH